MDEINFQLRSGSMFFILGPSNSGKSSLAIEIIRQRCRIYDEPPDKVFYCYSIYQPMFHQLSLEDPNVTFVNSIQAIKDEIVPNSLYVLDDQDITRSNQVLQILEDLALKYCHHQRVSVLVLGHSIFNKKLRQVMLNASYFAIFNFPRDSSTFAAFARQASPGNVRFLTDSYAKAVKSSEFGYLFLNFHVRDAKSPYFARSNVFPTENVSIYVPT